MTQAWAVGLDMGGTNIRCAAVSIAGDVLLIEHGPSLASRKAGDVAENVAAQTLHLLDTADRRGLGSPRAIGVAVPGPPQRSQRNRDAGAARRRMARIPVARQARSTDRP